MIVITVITALITIYHDQVVDVRNHLSMHFPPLLWHSKN